MEIKEKALAHRFECVLGKASQRFSAGLTAMQSRYAAIAAFRD
ncbi:hypothetical protein [Primorskyibacter flagellatus]